MLTVRDRDWEVVAICAELSKVHAWWRSEMEGRELLLCLEFDMRPWMATFMARSVCKDYERGSKENDLSAARTSHIYLHQLIEKLVIVTTSGVTKGTVG